MSGLAGSTIRRASSSRPLPCAGARLVGAGDHLQEPPGDDLAERLRVLPRMWTRSSSPVPSAIARASVGGRDLRLDLAVAARAGVESLGAVAGRDRPVASDRAGDRRGRRLVGEADLVDGDEAVAVGVAGPRPSV